jgi:hypothetical protein
MSFATAAFGQPLLVKRRAAGATEPVAPPKGVRMRK